MITTDIYYTMWRLVKEGQISERLWNKFCFAFLCQTLMELGWYND